MDTLKKATTYYWDEKGGNLSMFVCGGERMRDKAGYEVEEIDPSNKGKELHWKWKWITRISYFKTVSRNVAVTPYFILENRQRDDNKNATITPFRYTAFFLFF